MIKLTDNTISQDLLSRIYDVLWIITKEYKYGVSAIESYLISFENLLEFDKWPNAAHRFKRGFTLAKRLNKEELSNKYIEVFFCHCYKISELTYYPHSIIGYLVANGFTKQIVDRAVEICLGIIEIAKSKNDLNYQSEYYNLLGDLYHRTADYIKERSYRVLQAEAEVKLGDSCKTCNSSDLFNVTYHYKKAAEIYRTLPGKKERYNEIYGALLRFQKGIPNTLKQFEYSADLKELCERFTIELENTNFFEACKIYCKWFSSPDEESINRHIDYILNNSISRIFKHTIIDKSGRTIGEKESMMHDSDKGAKQEAIHYCSIHWSLMVPSIFNIFLNYINNSISFNKETIRELIYYNPFVEEGREEVFTEGIYQGINYNFISSIHILVPQVENMFRYILNKKGIITSFNDGSQEDYDISDLMNMNSFREELVNVFTKGVIVDFESLLIARTGANLRNRLAHGLLSYDECQSIPAAYCFGLICKVIIAGWIYIIQQHHIDEN